MSASAFPPTRTLVHGASGASRFTSVGVRCGGRTSMGRNRIEIEIETVSLSPRGRGLGRGEVRSARRSSLALSPTLSPAGRGRQMGEELGARVRDVAGAEREDDVAGLQT